MKSSLLVGASCAVVSLLLGCASAQTGTNFAAEPFDANAYTADRAGTTKAFTDVEKAGVWKESKKVLVPEFKVYFQLQAKNSAETGHALSGLGSNRKESRVSQKMVLQVDQQVLQEITDGLYADFVANLKSLGYEVVDAKALAESYPEFKKYFEGTSMKASPYAMNDAVVAFGPTGWKIEQQEFDLIASGLAKPGVTSAFNAFGTTLQDVMVRATDKLDAIRVQPIFVVGFGSVMASKGFNSASVQSEQGVKVLPGTQLKTGEGWTNGSVSLRKYFGANEAYGKFVDASTLTDKSRNIMSALGTVLGAGGNDSSTVVLQADSAKFKTLAMAQLKTAQELLFERVKMETAKN